jgi:hypothetical protein
MSKILYTLVKLLSVFVVVRGLTATNEGVVVSDYIW